MSGDRVFLDTNVVVYMQSEQDEEKRLRSREMVDRFDCVISTQVINELCHVLLRKFAMPAERIMKIIDGVADVCAVSLVNMNVIERALFLKEQYAYSYYDSLMLANAIKAGCRYILSEDMQDGQIIEQTLEIVNPYTRSSL